MATVLYITAHPLHPEESYSLAVGAEFIEAYREANPADEVVHLDLYKENIPQIDADVLRGGESFGRVRHSISCPKRRNQK